MKNYIPHSYIQKIDINHVFSGNAIFLPNVKISAVNNAKIFWPFTLDD